MSFLRNCWYVAGFPEDASRQPMTRTFLDEPVVIYRSEAGALVAMDNRCPHRFAPLDRGKLIGDAIQCPYHGLRFGTDGQCVHMPSGAPPPPRAQLRVYPIVEKFELMWIWMGDPALADPATIPDFAFLMDEQYGWFNGTLHAKANYQLFVDNLLDLSHAEFLHPMLSSDGWGARNEATVEQRGESLYVENIAKEDNIFALNRRIRPDFPAIGTTIQRERWDAPGVISLSVGFYAGDDKVVQPSGHFLTPETETTTHYFFRGGQDVAPKSPEVNAAVRDGVIAIFRDEDIPIIEAQQYLMGEVDWIEAEPAILKADSSAIRARRMMAKRIRLERAAEMEKAAAD